MLTKEHKTTKMYLYGTKVEVRRLKQRAWIGCFITSQ